MITWKLPLKFYILTFSKIFFPIKFNYIIRFLYLQLELLIE